MWLGEAVDQEAGLVGELEGACSSFPAGPQLKEPPGRLK